jgi:DNA-binding response OmpR family regulator
MEHLITGSTYQASPFISSILLPQLQRQSYHIVSTNDFENYIKTPTQFTFVDYFSLEKHLKNSTEKITEFLKNTPFSIVLLQEKNFKIKVQLLDFGFSACIDLPTATDVIVKIIRNNVLKTSQSNLYLQTIKPESYSPFTYLQDSSGKSYLVSGKKAHFLTLCEKNILEYLQKRNGFASKQELAYAGWHSFDIKPNTVTVLIKKLRKKINFSNIPYRINSLYGFGYKLESTLTHLRCYQEGH